MRKLLGLLAVAGLITAGVASASSLGQINEPTMAAGTVDLVGCEAASGGIDVQLVPQFTGGVGHPDPPNAVLKEMKVSNLSSDCNGNYLYGKFYDENDVFIESFWSSGFNDEGTGGNCSDDTSDPTPAVGQISGGEVTVEFCLADGQKILIEDIEGISMVVSNNAY